MVESALNNPTFNAALHQPVPGASSLHIPNLSAQADTGSGFRYSQALQCWVAREPLKVDDRVVKAAAKLGINLKWDDEGRICDITYLDSRNLLQELGGRMMSPAEYWRVYREAQLSGDKEFVQQLQTNQAVEWLDAVFVRNRDGTVRMLEHPVVEVTAEGSKIVGEGQVIQQPFARPGWFSPDNNIAPDTGMIRTVQTNRNKGTPTWSESTWKYWSTFLYDQHVAAIRGYVTSSGTPSLDLDIPVTAHSPVQMLRECRATLLSPALSEELYRDFDPLLRGYETLIANVPATHNEAEHHEFYTHRDRCLAFTERYGAQLVENRSKEAVRVRETLIDMLGVLRIQALHNGDSAAAETIASYARKPFKCDHIVVTDNSLLQFVQAGASALEDAIASHRKVVFVMGHRNPDTDTVVSSLFEAYRNALLDPETLYLPVLQAERMPDEIARLIGPELSGAILKSNDPRYQKLQGSGQSSWILVDHNLSEMQRFATSIVDHHILSKTAERQEIQKTWEMAGSCAAQITQKLLGMGLVLSPESARILHGATLMDTENRSAKKMNYRDTMIMNELQRCSGIHDESAFFQDLMSQLLNTHDARSLFERDYKQDWGVWGFAVAKVKGVFGPEGQELKPKLLSELVEYAGANNRQKNFALTVVKIVDYLADNEEVNRERLCLVFHEHADSNFKEAMFDFVERVIRFEFGARAQMKRIPEGVEFWGTGDQLSRKITAPDLGKIVEAFNEYYYSPGLGVHVRRQFLQVDPEVQKAATELGIQIFPDAQGRITNITYNEAKRLMEHLQMEMLSLPEYWRLYHETRERRDEQMCAHLVSPGFVEFLDTLVLDHKELVHHPKIIKDSETLRYEGERHPHVVKPALPGLIYPQDILPESGLPTRVLDPQHYDDPAVWRYWSPDGPVAVPTRGHIFLLGQPALDLKFHPDDALKNLGIRPCVRTVKSPKIIYHERDGELRVEIQR